MSFLVNPIHVYNLESDVFLKITSISCPSPPHPQQKLKIFFCLFFKLFIFILDDMLIQLFLDFSIKGVIYSSLNIEDEDLVLL